MRKQNHGNCTLTEYLRAHGLKDLPDDWFAFGRLLLKQKGLDPADIAYQASRFKDTFTTGALAQKVKPDWPGAFVEWVKNARTKREAVKT
jgi:hypothetical protein